MPFLRVHSSFSKRTVSMLDGALDQWLPKLLCARAHRGRHCTNHNFLVPAERPTSLFGPSRMRRSLALCDPLWRRRLAQLLSAEFWNDGRRLWNGMAPACGLFLDDTMSLSLACGCSWGQARLTIPCNKKSDTSPPLPASGILLTLFTRLPLLPIYAISFFRHRAKPPLFPPPIISTAPNSQLYNRNGEKYR